MLVTAPGADRPIGASPGYFYELDLLGVRWPRTAPALGLLRRWWPRLLFMRSFEVGTPLPLANPFLVDPSQRPEEVVDALIGRALNEAQRGGAPFTLVQNFTSCSGPVADVLRAHGMASVPIPSTAVVDVRFESFEEYLGSMRASYRRRANQTLARTEELTIEHRADFADLADELARLWRAIYDRAREIRREVLTPEYFRQASAVEETSTLIVRRPDGSIAAFGLLLRDGPVLSFMQCGFEEEAGRGEGAYFRLLYEIVRLGIEQRFRLVDLGVTTLAPKLDVGAVPIPLYAWIRCRNPLLQRVVASVARSSLQRQDDLDPRRVFKSAPRSREEIVAELAAAAKPAAV